MLPDIDQADVALRGGQAKLTRRMPRREGIARQSSA